MATGKGSRVEGEAPQLYTVSKQPSIHSMRRIEFVMMTEVVNAHLKLKGHTFEIDFAGSIYTFTIGKDSVSRRLPFLSDMVDRANELAQRRWTTYSFRLRYGIYRDWEEFSIRIAHATLGMDPYMHECLLMLSILKLISTFTIKELRKPQAKTSRTSVVYSREYMAKQFYSFDVCARCLNYYEHMLTDSA